jgi:hypothetical protein
MLTLEEIEALSVLEKAASSAPWCEHPNGTSLWTGDDYCGDDESHCVARAAFVDSRSVDNLELITATRNALPGLLALARDAYRFRALVHSLEADAREVLRGEGDAKTFCERVIIGAASACHKGEKDGLVDEPDGWHFCSWRESRLKEELDKARRCWKQCAETRAAHQAKRNELAVLLVEGLQLIKAMAPECNLDGPALPTWLAEVNAALRFGFGGDASPERSKP